MGGANLVMILIMFVIFYFLLIRPAQKRERERKALLAGIKKGDLVVTNGGLLGRVTGLTDAVITLEVAEKIRLRVLRTHIAGLQGTAIQAPSADQPT